MFRAPLCFLYTYLRQTLFEQHQRITCLWRDVLQTNSHNSISGFLPIRLHSVGVIP